MIVVIEFDDYSICEEYHRYDPITAESHAIEFKEACNDDRALEFVAICRYFLNFQAQPVEIKRKLVNYLLYIADLHYKVPRIKLDWYACVVYHFFGDELLNERFLDNIEV